MENPCYFYILTGLPFSGKTELAKEIEKKTGIRHFSGDKIIENLLPGRLLLIEEDRNQARRWSAGVAFIGLMSNSVIYDAINPTKEIRQSLWQRAERARAIPKLIYVNTSIENVERRFKNNKIRQKRSSINDNLFEDLINKYEVLDETEPHLIFDYRKHSAADWIQENILAA
jgi:adenylylsulfate kinase-like enzyme